MKPILGHKFDEHVVYGLFTRIFVLQQEILEDLLKPQANPCQCEACKKAKDEKLNRLRDEITDLKCLNLGNREFWKDYAPPLGAGM